MDWRSARLHSVSRPHIELKLMHAFSSLKEEEDDDDDDDDGTGGRGEEGLLRCSANMESNSARSIRSSGMHSMSPSGINTMP